MNQVNWIDYNEERVANELDEYDYYNSMNNSNNNQIDLEENNPNCNSENDTKQQSWGRAIKTICNQTG